MDKPWKNDECARIKAQYANYQLLDVGLLWCGVPEDRIDEFRADSYQLAQSGVGRAIWLHDDVDCLGAKTKALNEAIESGELPHGREDAQTLTNGELAAYERRHILGKNLKAWFVKEFPNEKPAFLFDNIEQSTHTAINADSFRALQADRDALRTRIENAETSYKALRKEKINIEKERDSLKETVEKMGAPNERSETTYQNIIAVLLEIIAGKAPSVEAHQNIENEAKLIDFISNYYAGYSGLSKSNLSRKFPECKRTLD